MRNIEAGTIQEAVKRAIVAFGGIEAAAVTLSVSTALISRAYDPYDEDRPGGMGMNYVNTLCRIEPKASAEMAEYFARIAGLRLIPVRSVLPPHCNKGPLRPCLSKG